MQITNSSELIEQLKKNASVLGILQYGSGIAPDGADTDICLVVSQRPMGLESIHFWIASGPVDMNIRTRDELRDGGVADLVGFDDVLREGKVLYEREPGLLEDSLANASSSPSPPLRDNFAGMRHGHAHVLTKLDYYKDRDPLLCNILLAGATHWLLGAYTTSRGLPYRGEKAALKIIRNNDPSQLPEFEKLASPSVSIEERIETLRQLTDKILAPVGGPWQKGEVLFFEDSTKPQPGNEIWEKFFRNLLQAD